MKQIYFRKIVLLLVYGISVNLGYSQTNSPGSTTQIPAASGTTSVNIPSAYGSSTPINYIRIWEPRIPFTAETNVVNSSDVTQVNKATQYFDGLGRPIQTVNWQASPNKKDLVAPIVYDAYGREQYQYLPYSSSGNDGSFKADPFTEQNSFYSSSYPGDQPSLKGESFFYSHTQFEPSSLNRVQKTFAPGNSWAGSEGSSNEHAVQLLYLINNSNDVVRIWNITSSTLTYSNNDVSTNIPSSPAVYAPGTLYKTVTLDEKGNAVVEYKDEQNHVILKKVQIGSSISSDYSGQDANWLCTYYVYDDLELLRFVIPPKAVAQLAANSWQLTAGIINELCFRYEYDYRNRMTAKKVPGAGWAYMVYDIRDRLVFTQDGNLRGKGSNGNNSTNGWWLATLYDNLNRPVQTAMMSGYNGTRDALQAVVNSQQADLSVTTQSTVISGNSPDLYITTREPGRALYSASNSVVFEGEFTSDDAPTSSDGTIFTAQIDGSGNVTTNGQQTISQYPVPSGGTLTPLTYTYYDDYSNTGRSYDASNNSKLDIGNNTYGEPLPSAASTMTKGLVTSTKIRVIENANDLTQGNWLETVNFYDDKGRSVQTQSTNYKGGTDITTTRYDFTNKPICSYSVHSNPAGNQTNLRVKSNIDYDYAGRPTQIRKQINDNPATSRTTTINTYDALGQLLTQKVGQKRIDISTLATPGGEPVNESDYAYNIRSWLKGINWSGYGGSSTTPATGGLSNNKWFAMDLSYDWGYNNNQYTGNISGQRWQSAGDGAERSYGYGYDNANRLLYADFNQNFGSGNSPSWSKSQGNFTIDFSIKVGDGINYSSAYDENGNIRQLQQMGLQLNSSNLIDNLHYTYYGNSNKLQNVIDYNNNAQSTLGDFKTNTSHPQYGTKSGITSDAAYASGGSSVYDYGYDINGNMITDNNKSISGNTGIDQTSGGAIVYNHLNLPYTITVAGKGIITYIYDAAGNKLEKRTVDNTASGKTTYTDYVNGYVYENNILQFFGQEEGRIRPKVNPDLSVTYNYDYFIKDHLGNTRMVLTDEWQQEIYPVATLEDASVAAEENYYSINSGDIVPNPASLNGSYPNNNGISDPNTTNNTGATSTKMYRLNGATGDKTGLGITLKVMAGDNISIFGKSFWHNNGAPSNNFPITSVLASFLNAFAGTGAVAAAEGGTVTAAALNSSAVTTAAVSSLLNNVPTPSNKPKAYINWILFDEQFRPVAASSNYSPVGDAEVIYTHPAQSVDIVKNGYLYVYCSNESNTDVFFDNLQVVHKRGPLLEESHYSSWGLELAGISSKAAGKVANKYKYNGGNELQHQEFSDGSGLELYDAHHRMYDPQIGRFFQIDALGDMSQNISPYVFASDNPISINDPLGLQDSMPHNLPTVSVVGYIKNQWNSFSNWFTGANVGYNGSGWGHGPRQWLANQFGLGNNANNLFQLGLHSQLQSTRVNLTGNLLNKLRTDPAMIAFQNKIIAALKVDPRFAKLAFVTTGKSGVEFGGQRWSANGENWGALDGTNPLAHSETWDVAANELTWAVRHANVDYMATVKSDGTIVIAFHLSDTFDLSAQKGRSEAYNNISAATGFLYHDVVGGNSGMKVNADWQTIVK